MSAETHSDTFSMSLSAEEGKISPGDKSELSVWVKGSEP